MDATNPPVFGSLYEIVALVVIIATSYVMLRAMIVKIQADIASMRTWQEGALEKLLAGQSQIMTGQERLLNQLVKSNEKVLVEMGRMTDKFMAALDAQRDRHGREHQEIGERLLEIALHAKR